MWVGIGTNVVEASGNAEDEVRIGTLSKMIGVFERCVWSGVGISEWVAGAGDIFLLAVVWPDWLVAIKCCDVVAIRFSLGRTDDD